MRVSSCIVAMAMLFLGSIAQAQTSRLVQNSASEGSASAAQPSTFVDEPRADDSLPNQLNANTVTIISGNPNGTYLYFAYDMSAVLDDGNDLRVLPIVGKGAGQNTKDLLFLKGVDMGITQSDILSHFNTTGELGPNIGARLRYVSRLYNEEMHVLVTPGIDSLQDLQGQKVNFSDAGSGTQISSRLIFAALGIEVEEVNMGQTDAFEAIKRGELAGTIAFGGKPTGAFSKLEADPERYKLINVPYPPELRNDYLPSTLTHGDYPQLIPDGKTIETIAVGSVLAVFNWAPDSDRYRRVAKFTKALFENFQSFLEKPRHPKWREVNLAATLPGWKRFNAAQELLDENAGGQVAQSELTQQFEQFITNTIPQDPAEMSDKNKEELFRSFMEWRETIGNR